MSNISKPQPKSVRQTQYVKLLKLVNKLNYQVDGFNKKDEITQQEILETIQQIYQEIYSVSIYRENKPSSDLKRQNDFKTQEKDSYSDWNEILTDSINKLVTIMDFKSDVLEKNKQAVKNSMKQKDLDSFLVILKQLIYLTNNKYLEKNYTNSNTVSTHASKTENGQSSNGSGQASFLNNSQSNSQLSTQQKINQNENMEDKTLQNNQKNQGPKANQDQEYLKQNSNIQSDVSAVNEPNNKAFEKTEQSKDIPTQNPFGISQNNQDQQSNQQSQISQQQPFDETSKNLNTRENPFNPTESKGKSQESTQSSTQSNLQKSQQQLYDETSKKKNTQEGAFNPTESKGKSQESTQSSTQSNQQSQKGQKQTQNLTSKNESTLEGTFNPTENKGKSFISTQISTKNPIESQQFSQSSTSQKIVKVEERKIMVKDQNYKIISTQKQANEKLIESLNKVQQNWQSVEQQRNPAHIEDKQKVHSKYQSAQPYSPNLINQGFVEINNPQQFKNNEIEYIANQNQRMYYKITMRNEFTICSQFCDPDEQVNGFRNPDPEYDFCIPHSKILLAANSYLYHSPRGKKELVNMRFTLHNRIQQQDSYLERELKKYQELKSILESNIPISFITRNHPNDYFPSLNSQTVSEEVIDILKKSNSENKKEIKEEDKVYLDNMNILLKIYHKKRINEDSWTDFLIDLKKRGQQSQRPSDNKQINNIANIFAKNKDIKSIAKEIHGDIQNLKELRYVLSDKNIHLKFMNDICYTINNQQIKTQEIYYQNDVLRSDVYQLIDKIKSSNGYFSYDETKVCEIFYELTCLQNGDDLKGQIEVYNYLPITMLKSSGYEQKWLVIDLKANQIKLNEYDSDEDIDEEDQNKKSNSRNSINNYDNIKKLKVLSIYTKEYNAQYSKHKQAVLEIKGSQKCAYNLDSTTIATNYYQLSLEKMRNLDLGDQELIQVFYLALKELQNFFKNGFHFLSLNPKNIFLHIKATGSQRFKVKFHIDSSCYKPTQYYNPTFSPGLINQYWIPYSYDDMSYFKKQTLYSLCLSFLNIITQNEGDIYNLDPHTILNNAKSYPSLKENYPNFSKFIEVILIYGSTDDVSTLLNLIKKDYIDQQYKNKQKFDFSILLHNKNNMQKVIDTQINKFTRVIQEFFTPRRIYERVMFFYYTNQFQKLKAQGDTENIYLYVDQLLRSLTDQGTIACTCPENLLINQVSIHLTKILFYQFKEREVQEQFEKIKTLDSKCFTETQLCRALIGKQTIKFQVSQTSQSSRIKFTCSQKPIEITEEMLKKNLASKFIIQILKEKPRLCEKYASEDVPSKIKLKMNERRFSEVQDLIDEYYIQREKYRKNIFFTPIKLSYYDDMINCRIGVKKLGEAFLYTNENFELKLNLFGWESVESANGCNSVGYVLFYLRKIKESQFYVEQAIFWSIAYKGTDNAELATSYNNIAYLVVNNNEIENSQRYHYKALKIRKQLHPKGHNDLGSTYNNIGQNLTRLKKNNESLHYYQKAIKIWIRLMGYKHNTVSLALSNIANTYTQMQKYDHSIIFHRISYSVRYQTLKQESIDAGQLSASASADFVQINNHDLAITLDNIGFAYTKQEKYEEALKVQELAKKMWKELCQRNQSHLQSFIVSLNNLGNTHKKMKNYDRCFQETYDTQKILKECRDDNLVKSQQNVIRSIKNEINRYVIMTLREINCYLQVNQSEQAIVFLFKIAHLYDRILSQIQLVEEINHIRGLDDKLNLQKLGITTQQQQEGINKIFPYIIFNQQPYYVRIPPRCYQSSVIDSNEKEIENFFRNLQILHELTRVQVNQGDTTAKITNQSTQSQLLQQFAQVQDQKTEKETNNNKELIFGKRNEFIKERQTQALAEFTKMETRFTTLHQFIMVLLLFSIGDILFDKIISKLKDQEFQKQSKEIFTELKYIIDAHITGDIGKIFSNYKTAFEKRQ
ncbi:hypothetical protein ABPG72_011030 [Tetrahymena utriculariae]